MLVTRAFGAGPAGDTGLAGGAVVGGGVRGGAGAVVVVGSTVVLVTVEVVAGSAAGGVADSVFPDEHAATRTVSAKKVGRRRSCFTGR
ncbi:MAG: hypothetical protein M3P34_01365 [Actinomycetota bacterium]|nr:hypothetical protein [Actinomycetota bacterium]